MPHGENDERVLDRRGVLKGSTALWVTPSVVSFAAIATAMGSTLRPYITSSENVLVIDPPPSIKRNVQENDDDTFVFQETTCAPLAQDLVVDRASDGNFRGSSSEGATIPAGTLAAAFIVLVDRASSGRNVGSVSFSDPILGLSYRRPSFEAGTAQFGIPGLCYPTTTGTYFEGNDALTLAGDTFTWSAQMGGVWADVARVIVAC